MPSVKEVQSVDPGENVVQASVVSEGKNFKVETSVNQGKNEYHCWVYNNDGMIMYEGTLGEEPVFSHIDNDILQKETGSGDVAQYQYFDTHHNMVSPLYENLVMLEYGKIVYMTEEGSGTRKLVISDVFDSKIFYREYVRDFSTDTTLNGALLSADYIDQNHLEIRYLSWNGLWKVTESIDLNAPYPEDTQSYADHFSEKERANYKVIASLVNGDRVYHYWIFNNDGKALFDETLPGEPDISYIDDDIIRVRLGAGNVWYDRFFNTSENLISPQYDTPTLADEGKIVYMKYEGKGKRAKLIVSDLFDDSAFHKEYSRDFSSDAIPYDALTGAKFIDKDHLGISYLTGKNYAVKYEIIDLGK